MNTFSIRKSKDQQFYPVEKAENGEIVATGELHPQMQGAIRNAIAMGCPDDQLPLTYEGSTE